MRFLHCFVVRSEHIRHLVKEVQDIVFNISVSARHHRILHSLLHIFQSLLEDSRKQLRRAQEDVTAANNTISGYTLRQNTRAKRRDDLQNAIREHTQKLDSVSAKARVFRAMERDFDSYNKAVKMVMQEAQRGALRNVHGPVSRLIRTEDNFAVAIEIAMGSGLQNIVVDKEEDGKRGIEYLKRTNGGRATFRPLTAIKDFGGKRRDLKGERGFFGYGDELVKTAPQYKNLINSMLGTTAVCQDMDCAIAMSKKYGYSFRIVTLDGQLVNAGGSLTGGSTQKSAGILSRKQEIDELLKKAAAAEKLPPLVIPPAVHHAVEFNPLKRCPQGVERIRDSVIVPS